jgi:molecular chaperone GrpE
VVDSLDRALEHAHADPASIVEGIRAVRDEALRILESFGFPRQETEPGSPFDPLRHEAVATVADDEVPEGAIVHVARPGYGEGENQLRPAMVVVSTGKQ